jgi:hypothetical protein
MLHGGIGEAERLEWSQQDQAPCSESHKSHPRTERRLWRCTTKKIRKHHSKYRWR